MTVRIANAAAQAGLNAITALIGGSGVLEVYTGTMPANCEDAATGTLLATLSFSATAFASATDTNPGARAAANVIAGAFSVATGTAAYARIKTSAGGTCVIQGTVGENGTTGHLATFNTLNFVVGVAVAVNSLYLRVPETQSEA